MYGCFVVLAGGNKNRERSEKEKSRSRPDNGRRRERMELDSIRVITPIEGCRYPAILMGKLRFTLREGRSISLVVAGARAQLASSSQRMRQSSCITYDWNR